MDNPVLKQKPLAVIKIWQNTWEIIRKNWLNLLSIIIFITGLIIAILIILWVIWQLCIMLNLIQPSYFLTFNLGWTIISFVVFFLLTLLAQFLIINYLLNPLIKLRENIGAFFNLFWDWLCLNVILNLALLLFSLPLYVGLFLLLTGNTWLGIACLLFGAIIILFFSSYLIFSPFILLDKKLSWLESLKKSFLLASGFFRNILFKILILVLVLLILNSLSTVVLKLQYIGVIISAFILLLMIYLSFAYLFAIYLDLKKLKNI
ncbi:MAG: hypothetical protein WC460_03965 [Patescibacteria group bacterium]